MKRSRKMLRRPAREFLKKLALWIWAAASIAVIIDSAISHHPWRLLWIFSPVLIYYGIWFISYFLVLLHEMGHAILGKFLGFPVKGIEIGPYPHTTLRVKKFTFRVGKFPGAGKTLLGFSSRSHSRRKRFYFLMGGIIFEFIFFAGFFILCRGHWWVCGIAALLCLDQLVVNFVPRYENGLPANDGASVVALLFPRTFA